MKMVSQLLRATVFLDRDGTLNHDAGYITSPEDLILFPGVVESVARLNQFGCRLVLVTNQSAIGRGLMTEDDLHLIHQKLHEELGVGRGWLDGIFVCPHQPNDACECRKPNPGLIKQATKELGVNVLRSYLVGDKRIDIELANAVGSIGVLVMTSEFSKEALKAIESDQCQAGFVASDFCDAADWIVEDAKKREWI